MVVFGNGVLAAKRTRNKQAPEISREPELEYHLYHNGVFPDMPSRKGCVFRGTDVSAANSSQVASNSELYR